MGDRQRAGKALVNRPANRHGQALGSGANPRLPGNRVDELMPQTDVGRSEDLLAELAGWVKLETPTTDPAAVNRLMDMAEGELARQAPRSPASRAATGTATT